MSRVYYGQRGYVRCSKSVNAYRAEADGRLPLTHAKREVAAQHGCSQATAAAALELLHDGEWHHTGKYARQTAYYDLADERLAGVIAHITACGGAAKWKVRRARLNSARRQTYLGNDGARWYQPCSEERAREIGSRQNGMRLRRELAAAIAAGDVKAIRYNCFLLGEGYGRLRAKYAALATELTGGTY